MKISLLLIGKTDEAYLNQGVSLYEKRIKHYIPFEIKIIQEIKKAGNLSAVQLAEKEGEAILRNIDDKDEVILLDERGKEHTSEEFAGFLKGRMNTGLKNIVFVIGGPYGFSKQMYSRCTKQGCLFALSKMTFSHQLVRLIFVEQLYRAFTIIKGEPYHH